MNISKFIHTVFIIFFIYFAALAIYYFILALIALTENRQKSKEHYFEDYSNLSASGFTFPVSIIIPAHNEEDWILDSLKAVLNLKYPEFEVIIVNDGSTDKTAQILASELKLRAVDMPHIPRFDAGKIQGTFKSDIYPNMAVISKAAGFKKAGAVNVGLEFAKYPYVCVVDGDTILEPDALLEVMAQVEKDPGSIIGIGSFFGLVNGFKVKNGVILEKSFSFNPIIANQNLEYMRSFMLERAAWSKFNASPNVAGGFGIWRRDILLHLGGYATDFSSEDIEFTFRAQDYIIEKKKEGYKILALPYCVGWTEGPSDIISLISQRNRWQRVINETIWKYKHMILSPRYKTFAFLTLPYYLFYESLGVFIELASIILIVAGALARVLDLKAFLAFVVLIVLSQAVISLLSIFAFARGQKVLRTKDIIYFIFLSFAEYFWYHWILLIAKILGTIDFLRGFRGYDQYQRSKRRD